MESEAQVSEGQERLLAALGLLARQCREPRDPEGILEEGLTLLGKLLGVPVEAFEYSDDGAVLQSKDGTKSLQIRERPELFAALLESDSVEMLADPASGEMIHWIVMRGCSSSCGVLAVQARDLAETERLFLQDAAQLIGTAVERVKMEHERRRSADEEKRLLAELRAAVHLRDEFLLVASHELRTPLTPLNIELQMLRRILAGEREELLVRVDRAVRQVDRLGGMVDDMLEVSRITADRLQLELEVMDLGSLVREVVDRFRVDAERRGVEFRISAEEAILGLWDRHRLAQVFEALVSNSLRFGAGRPVDVRVSRRGDVARVEIRDHGIGIAPDQIERIFQQYARAVAFRVYGGLGLGLFLSRKLVQAHGGRVWAEPSVGKGALFIVELPWGPF